MSPARTAIVLAFVRFAIGCSTSSEPPAPLSTSTTAVVSNPTKAVASDPSSVPDSSVTDASAGDATTTDAVTADAATPELLAADGATLPQTDAMPSTDSVTYQARMNLLWRAIVEDAPDLATPAFFPVIAYEQVKAVPKPSVDWNRRLLAAFQRDIHAYHRKLGPTPGEAKLLGIDVATSKAHWVKPAEEMNKLGYDRVFHTKIRFTRSDGKDSALDILSMISWRGEWYVVHLASLK